MNIFSPFNCFFRCTYNRLLDSYNRSQQLQEELFFFLIDKGSKTLFGFDHNFKKIKSIDDFNKYVPISTYEQILPYIDTMMRGEQNVLWPTKIKFFAQSFGTTNLKNKHIIKIFGNARRFIQLSPRQKCKHKYKNAQTYFF